MKSWFSRWRHNPLISAGVCEEIIISWHLCNAPQKVTGGRAEVLKWEGKKNVQTRTADTFHVQG